MATSCALAASSGTRATSSGWEVNGSRGQGKASFPQGMPASRRGISCARFRSPWQNGTAERWIGSCRRELLAHVVVFGERHLVRLVRSYVSYYHKDRCHLGLGKDTPDERPITPRPSPTAKVMALPRVGGLHHRYEWREAA